MSEVPQVVYWEGQLLSEVPRDELEQALIDTHQRWVAEQERHLNCMTRFLKFTAEVGRERLKAQRPWFARLFDA